MFILYLFSACCLFLFFDGSAHFFDEYLRRLTGVYRLMFGLVNGFPHYVARNCNEPQRYQKECSYIWNTGYVPNCSDPSCVTGGIKLNGNSLGTAG